MTEQTKALVSWILKETFGETVEKIGHELASRGSLSLLSLVEYTALDHDHVVTTLNVLIQQNLVVFKKVLDETDVDEDEQEDKRNELGSGVYVYELVIKNVLLILLFPRFIVHAQNTFGEQAEMIVEELLHHGQLTRADLLSKVQDIARKLRGIGAGEDNNETASTQETEKVLEKMIEEKYLEATDRVLSSTLTTSTNTTVTAKDKASSKPPTKKRKREVQTPVEFLFRVNYDRMLRDFREKAVVNHVRERVDSKASHIVRCMYHLSSFSEQDSAKASGSVNIDQLARTVETKEANSNIDLTNVTNYLLELSKEERNFVTQVASTQYAVNTQHTMESVKLKLMESHISQKYGILSLRIFRLLLLKKFLDQKQIAKLAMIPLKETRSRLYAMLNDRLLFLQEIPRIGSTDHAPSRTLYLWAVDLAKARQSILQDMEKAVRNLKMRLHHEIGKSKTSLAVNTEADHVVTGVTLTKGLAGRALSNKDKAEVKRITSVEQQIENSVLHVAWAIVKLRYL